MVAEAHMTRIVRSTALLLFLGAAGCGGNEPQAKQPEPAPSAGAQAMPAETTPPLHEMSAPPPVTSADETNAPPPPPPEATTPPPPPALADDQILQALHTP